MLVLGAGGTIGAAWMAGVLAGIAGETGIDFAACEHVVGTSGGAMLAADLLAGLEPRATVPGGARAADESGSGTLLPEESNGAATEAGEREGASRRSERLRGAARRGSAAAGALAAPFALSLGRVPGALARAAALARIEAPEQALDDLGARIAGHGLEWDGRLRIVCVDRSRGTRVVFGAPGGPAATVAEAVQASCSIPWAFRAVRIGEDDYVDGAVWSPTNMDVAPGGRETQVLCLAPMAAPLGARERHPAVRAATTTAIGLETAALRRRGARVDVVSPAPADPGEHVRAVGWRQGRAFARSR